MFSSDDLTTDPKQAIFSRNKPVNDRSISQRVLMILEHPISAWIILGTSLVLTLLAWNLSNRYIAKKSSDRFNLRIERVKQQIEERMLEYEQVLRGGVGLFEASDSVSRQEWKTYVANCELQRFYPGLQGMGVSLPLTPKTKPIHEAEVQSEGHADYKIHPAGERDFYSPVVYIEPFDWRNQRAFGYDMYSESNRRHAMDRAIDTGLPTISGPITLVQETENDMQRGFLCYMPMYYRKPDLQTPAERRSNFTGFVYAAFRAEDLLSGISGDHVQEIKFELYDSNVIAAETLLADTDADPHYSSTAPAPVFSKQVGLHLSGRDWSIYFESQPGFVSGSEKAQSLWVAFGGFMVDILLFFVIASIARQRKSALIIASRITQDLGESEELNRSILRNASEAIITVDPKGTIELFNKAAEQMFGFPLQQAKGLSFDQLISRQSWASLLELSTKGSRKDSGFIVKGIRWPGRVHPLSGDAGNAELDQESSTNFPCRITIGTVTISQKLHCIIIARDETDRLKSESELANINRQLVDASHKSGMAKVATGVLHNVGNVLNSLSMSSVVVLEKVKQCRIPQIRQAAEMLYDHKDELEVFLNHDVRGKHFPNYLNQATLKLVENNNSVIKELLELRNHVQHITQIINVQQCDAAIFKFEQEENINDLLDDAVKINQARNSQLDIVVTREFEDCPVVTTDRHKVLQILVNVFKNAQESVDKNNCERKIFVRTRQISDVDVQMEIEDTGTGIEKENLKKMLQFGFTTKQDGHGFGLHSSLIAAKQLGGRLVVTSQGQGQGATFTLTIPIGLPLSRRVEQQTTQTKSASPLLLSLDPPPIGQSDSVVS